MSPKRWGPFFTLWLCLFALTARAQSVVVLEFSGDRKAKLRTQVEAALKRARKVKVAPLLRYKAAAAKAKLRGGKAMTPQAVAALAPKLKLDAAVEGTIEETFFVRIIDSQGNELWSKDLPLKRGLISAKNAKRLAAAIATAAKMAAQGEGGNAAQASEDAADSEEPPEAPPPPPKPPEPPAPPEPPPVVEEPKPAPGLPAVAIPDPPKNETAQQRERRQRDEARESHTVTEAPPPETEKAQTVEADEGPRVGPRLITLQLAGLTTWRSFCARPGVSSCGDFDALAEQDRPQGERVDFSAQVPYLGIGGAVELFPLARMDGFLKGLGLGATYSRGFSLTNVRVESADGTTPETEVVSVEQAYSLYLAPRYFFPFGDDGESPLSGYAGLRVGLSGRSFEVDPSATVPLPGSHRSYPILGADVSFPLIPLVRLEASGFYFLNPKAGAEERALYGVNATGSGWSAELGAAGDLWGPFGYVLRFRYAVYQDTYSGGGSKWTEVDVGASRETYTGFLWGLTAHY